MSLPSYGFGSTCKGRRGWQISLQKEGTIRKALNRGYQRRALTKYSSQELSHDVIARKNIF